VSSFVSKVKISNKTLYCKELRVKQHKVILKSLLGDAPDYESAFYNISNILAELTDLKIDEIHQLNIIDFFLLLFEVRSLSIGSSIAAETTGEKVIKLKLNITKFSECLKNINVKDLLQTETVDDINIEYKLPTIQDIVNIDINSQETIYKLFVKALTVKDLYIDLTGIDSNAHIKILDYLPAKITSHFNKRSQSLISKFNNINLLSYLPGLKNRQLIFNFNINNLGSILKLLFGEQLLTLYSNIFTLCNQGNLTPEYIENCTPGEYILFVKKIEEINQISKASLPLDVNVPTENFGYPDVPATTSKSEFPSIG
jgi:hypothetical protein